MTKLDFDYGDKTIQEFALLYKNKQHPIFARR